MRPLLLGLQNRGPLGLDVFSPPFGVTQMQDVLLGQDWPVDWAGNLRLDYGEDAWRRMLLFSGMAVSAYPLRSIELACRGLPLRLRLQALPGHIGDTGVFQDVTWASFMAEAEQNLFEMAAHGEPIDLGGFSGGAVLACLLAARHPHLVRSLFLIGFCPRLKGRVREMVVSGCGLMARVPFAQQLVRRVSFRVKESGAKGVMHELYRRQPRFPRYSAAAFAILSRMQSQLPRSYARIRVPVHFFHGRLDDRASLDQVARVSLRLQRHTQSTLTVYDSSPHCLPLGPEAEQFGRDFRDTVLRS